jgi:hypothetical protein
VLQYIPETQLPRNPGVRSSEVHDLVTPVQPRSMTPCYFDCSGFIDLKISSFTFSRVFLPRVHDLFPCALLDLTVQILFGPSTLRLSGSSTLLFSTLRDLALQTLGVSNSYTLISPGVHLSEISDMLTMSPRRSTTLGSLTIRGSDVSNFYALVPPRESSLEFDGFHHASSQMMDGPK